MVIAPFHLAPSFHNTAAKIKLNVYKMTVKVFHYRHIKKGYKANFSSGIRLAV